MTLRENIGDQMIAKTIGLSNLDWQTAGYLHTPRELPSDWNFLGTLLLRAELARGEALSYRNFAVGVAGSLRVPRAPYRGLPSIVHGANMKPFPGNTSGINVHAEDFISESAKRYAAMKPRFGAPSVGKLAIIGELNDDVLHEVATHTLHPCGPCRSRFQTEQDTPFSDQTIVLGSTPDFKHAEVYRLGSLYAHYKTGTEAGIYRERLGGEERLERLTKLNDFVLEALLDLQSIESQKRAS